MGRLNVQVHEFRMRRSANEGKADSANGSSSGIPSTTQNPYGNDDVAHGNESFNTTSSTHSAGGGGSRSDRLFAPVSAESFCVTRCGENPLHKSIFSEDRNTNKHEILRFIIDESQDVLRIEVWSNNTNGYFFQRKQLFHGMCSVKLDPDAGSLASKALRRGSTTDMWHPIHKKGQLRGELRISLEAVDFGASGYVGTGSMGSHNSHGYDRNKNLFHSNSYKPQPVVPSSSNTNAAEFPDDYGIGVPKDKKPADAALNSTATTEGMVMESHDTFKDPFAKPAVPMNEDKGTDRVSEADATKDENSGSGAAGEAAGEAAEVAATAAVEAESPVSQVAEIKKEDAPAVEQNTATEPTEEDAVADID